MSRKHKRTLAKARQRQQRTGTQPVPMPTSERLALALADAGAPVEMIERARAGHYGDYSSELAFPLSQLVADATAAGLNELAERVRHGEFDATKEEADAWAASDEDQRAFADLLNGGLNDPAAPGGDAYEVPAPFDLSGDDIDRDKAMLYAAVDLASRTGAVGFDFDYGTTVDETPEGVRSARTTWHVEAYYNGVRLIEQDHDSPTLAAWAFAVRVLNGGKCRCGKVSSLDPRGVFAVDKGMLSGETWTVEQQRQAGVCHWELDRADALKWRWVGDCGAGREQS